LVKAISDVLCNSEKLFFSKFDGTKIVISKQNQNLKSKKLSFLIKKHGNYQL